MALNDLEARVRAQGVMELREKLADLLDGFVSEIPSDVALRQVRVPKETMSPLVLLDWLVQVVVGARTTEVGDKAVERLLASASELERKTAAEVSPIILPEGSTRG